MTQNLSLNVNDQDYDVDVNREMPLVKLVSV
jgi:hypothetical protein